MKNNTSMNCEFVDNPSQGTVEKLLGKTKRLSGCLIIALRCSVEYTGQQTAHLPPANRLLVIKSDSTVLVHNASGYEPEAWQAPPNTVQFSHMAGSNDCKTLVALAQGNSQSVLSIHIQQIGVALWVGSLSGSDGPDKQISGSEEDLRTRICRAPSLVESGFVVLDTEYDTPGGPVDIWGQDESGTPVIVELKAHTAGLPAAGQLHRYVRSMDEKAELRGILIAPGLAPRADEFLAATDLEFVQLSPDPP